MLGFLGRRERWPYREPNGRVALKPLQARDVPQIRAWLQDLELVRYSFGLNLEPARLEQIAEEYCREIAAGRRNILALDTDDGRLIGFLRFSLRPGPQGLVARVGILLGLARDRGRGLGTEAMRLLLSYLFEVRRVASVELDTADFNRAAQRCFEKVGFQRRVGLTLLGSAPSQGAAANKIWMEFSRESWEGRQKGP